jgi:hypothetical protein
METAWIISRETWAWGVHWGLVAWICIFCLMHQKDVKDTGEPARRKTETARTNRNGKSRRREQKARADGKNSGQKRRQDRCSQVAPRYRPQANAASLDPRATSPHSQPRSTSAAGSEKLRTVSKETKDQIRTNGTLLPIPGPLLWVMVMATAARPITPSAWLLLLRSSPAGCSLGLLRRSVES